MTDQPLIVAIDGPREPEKHHPKLVAGFWGFPTLNRSLVQGSCPFS